MAFNDAALNTGGDAMAAAYPWIALHTSGTVADSTNESNAGRLAAGWSAATSGGNISSGPHEFTGGTADGAVVRVGYWSAETGGEYGGGSLLSGDQQFNAAGEYTVTEITETGSSS